MKTYSGVNVLGSVRRYRTKAVCTTYIMHLVRGSSAVGVDMRFVSTAPRAMIVIL